MKYKKIGFLFLLSLSCLHAYCQNAFDSSLSEAISVHANKVGVNAHIYNGSEYTDYDHRLTGDPFFASSYFDDGSVVYDGIVYPHVIMFYDLLHDDVVIKNYNEMPMILTKEKVSSFDYAGHHFTHLVTDSSATGMKPGFYDVLYNGSIQLLAKRKKEIEEKIGLQYSESFFVEKNEYYLVKKNMYYPVSDRKSMLRVLKERRSDLSKFMSQQKIKFKKDQENSMIRLAAYYDSLNNAK